MKLVRQQLTPRQQNHLQAYMRTVHAVRHTSIPALAMSLALSDSTLRRLLNYGGRIVAPTTLFLARRLATSLHVPLDLLLGPPEPAPAPEPAPVTAEPVSAPMRAHDELHADLEELKDILTDAPSAGDAEAMLELLRAIKESLESLVKIQSETLWWLQQNSQQERKPA
jgi:hypothetical protein